MDKYPAATFQSEQSTRNRAAWERVCVCVCVCVCGWVCMLQAPMSTFTDSLKSIDFCSEEDEKEGERELNIVFYFFSIGISIFN